MLILPLPRVPRHAQGHPSVPLNYGYLEAYLGSTRGWRGFGVFGVARET